MEKLWSECSKEEHDAIREWNKHRRYFSKAFASGLITFYTYQKVLKRLEYDLKEIERKYDETM